MDRLLHTLRTLPLLLPLMLLLLGGTAKAVLIDREDAFTRTFQWKFEDCNYSFRYDFPWELYHFYQEKPRVYHNYAVYTLENRRYQFLPDFMHELACYGEANGLDKPAILRWVIAMVQQLEYRNDKGEYPKFPIETLAERGGDCEDTSILLAAMLEELGYPTILINPPGHMALAVSCEGCQGAAYRHAGRYYYYVETTASGFGVGDIPEAYRLTADQIMPMTVRPADTWILHAFLPKRKLSGELLYFVSEDAGTVMAQSHKGETLRTHARVRHVRMDGKVSTIRSFIRADKQ